MINEVPGRLPVNWDSYWKGFMSFPAIEHVRFTLVRRACERLLKGFVAEYPRPQFCELGAGTGAVSHFMGRKYQADVVIVDSNPDALTLSKKTFQDYPHAYTPVHRDVFDLTEYKNRFDLVHSGGLIEHFIGEARDLIIDAHCDLVRDKGYLLILVPIHNGWYRLLNEGIFKYLHLLDEIPEVPWSLQELEGKLSPRGFKIVTVTTVISELGILAKKIH